MNPIWKPTQKEIKHSHIYQMMQRHQFENYHDFWKWSVTQKEQFLYETIQNLGIVFKERFNKIYDLSKGVEQPIWLPNATLNIVDSCFQNNDDSIAIIFQEEGKSIQQITQKELENLVNQIANSLRQLGIKKGDSIAIDMPMTLEAVAIYLAGVKAGNPIVTIADSFTPNEIAVRLKIAQPKVVFTQDFIHRAGKKLPLLDKVIEAGAENIVVIKTVSESNNLQQATNWTDFLQDNKHFDSVIQTPEEVITILFSSGTTGEPKAIPWNHTTPIKGALDGYYHHDIHKNDVVCWPTNLGWMMGPWLVFASLINKASMALYYGAPIGREFGEFVSNAKVTMLGLVPSIVKHWKNSQCMEGLDWNSIKCFSSTGEVSNPEEYKYLSALADGKPIIEYCGGTEIGGGYVTSTLVQDNVPSVFTSQALGTEFILLDEDNNPSEEGELFLIPPILGLSNTLLNRNHHQVYFEGAPTYKGKVLRRHGDRLVTLKNNYYRAQGRTDDAMNLGGIKVSSIQIEEVINKLDFIKESAAVAISPKGGGPSVLIVYYVENSGDYTKEERLKHAQNSIRKQLNPLFKVSNLIKKEVLPRTASGKVMRKNLRKEYEN
jgi:acetyl-CoA synthetase